MLAGNAASHVPALQHAQIAKANADLKAAVATYASILQPREAQK